MKSFGISCINKKKWIGIFAVIIYNIYLVYTVWHKNLIYYTTNDDYFMAMIYSGMLGDYYSQALFSNTIYGWILSTLYRLFPIWNWMTILYVAVSIISFATLAYVYICVHEMKSGVIMAMVILSLFHTQLYCSINFTKFAMLFSVAGILLLVYSYTFSATHGEEFENGVTVKKDSIFGILVGAGLTLWGSMIRFEVFLMTLPFILCLVDYKKVYYNIKNQNKKFNFQISKKQVALIAIVLTFVFTYIFNSITYNNNRWNQAIEDNKESALLLDFGYIPKNSVDCGNVIIDNEDIDFYTSWHLADKSVFSYDNLSRMVAQSIDEGHTEGVIGKRQDLGKWCIEIFEKIISNHLFIVGVLIAIIGALLAKIRLRKINFILSILMCLFEEVYLEFRGKFVERVYIIPVFIMCVICIFNALLVLETQRKDEKKGNRLKYIENIGCIILLVFALVKSDAVTHDYADRERTLNHEEIMALYEQLNSEDDNNLYILDDIGADLDLMAYSVYDSYDFGLLKKVAFDYGWQSRIPYNYEQLKDYGSEDTPYIPLAYNENVFLLGNVGLEDRLNFMRRHYDNNIAVSLVRSIGDYNIYSFSPPIGYKSKNNMLEWQIDSIKKSSYDENFITISGNIDYEDIDQLYLEIENSDDTKKCYRMSEDSELNSGKFVFNLFGDDIKEGAMVSLIINSRNRNSSTSSMELF